MLEWRATDRKWGRFMTTSGLKTSGINHVVLHVSDVERSKRFYMDVLGFEQRNINPNGTMVFLRCGQQGLDLFERSGDVHGGEEMNHMALNIDGGDLDEIIDAMTRLGVTISERTRRNTVMILDPDGHQIEMLPLESLERTRQRAASGALSS
jgi:catechol 2,3-dioxygenase-like lactoylglutathione lyase family enzyme